MKFVRLYKERKARRRQRYQTYVETFDKLEMMVGGYSVAFMGFSRYNSEVQSLYQDFIDHGELFSMAIMELTWLDWLLDRTEIYNQMVVSKYRDTQMKRIMFSTEELTKGKFKHVR